MKLLFITKDLSQYIEKSTHYLILELAKQTQLSVWSEDGYIDDILKQIDFIPDFILLNDYKREYCPFIRGLNSVNIPVGIIMHDLHYKKVKRKRFIDQNNIKYIFTVYRDAFLKWFPEYKDRMIWFPHHVPTHIFTDYQLPKNKNWLMTGAMIEHLYPFRARILNGMKKENGFSYMPHPGYRNFKSNKRSPVGLQYARELNQAKMVMTCHSIYQFPLLKYFEVLGCRSLLMAPTSAELTDLGFIDGQTFVAINESNFKEKALFYLQHEKARLAIANNGYEMVRRRHSTGKRAQELIRQIHNIVDKHGGSKHG